MKVTVKDKEGLQTHATESENAAAEYVNNISATERQFTMKVEGSYTSAINKFQERLNSISTILHEDFPQSLEKYGETILTYIADLGDAGFSPSQVIKTKDDDIEKIKNWLTSEKSKEFSTILGDLTPAVTAAKDALALSPKPYELSEKPTVESIQKDIDAKLKTLSDARETTHQALNTALNTFKTNLQEVSASLAGINAAILNAANIGTLSISELTKMIKNGQLTDQNMQLINSIQDAKDIDVLRLLLNEGDDKKDFFTKLGSVESKHVSNAMMDLLYYRVNQEYNLALTYEDNKQNIQTFVVTISEQDKDAAKDYFEKLTMAGDRYASILSIRARGLMPALPASNADASVWAKYESERADAIAKYPEIETKMAKAGVLTSLFESLAVANVGKNETIIGGRKYDVTSKISNLQFVDGGFTYDLTTRELKNGIKIEVEESTEKISSNSYTDFDKVAKSEKFENLREIREKRNDALKDYAKELLGVIAGKVVPGGDSFVELVFSQDDVLEKPGATLSYINSGGKAALQELHSKIGGEYFGDYATLVSHIDGLKEIDAEEAKAKKDATGAFFYAGGRTMSGESTGYVKYDMTYDLQSIMARDDIEKNGLRGYYYDMVSDDENTLINEKIDNVKKYEDKMQSSRPEMELSSYESYEFLTGQGGYTVEDIGIENINNDIKNVSDNKEIPFNMSEYEEWQHKIYGLGDGQNKILERNING